MPLQTLSLTMDESNLSSSFGTVTSFSNNGVTVIGSRNKGKVYSNSKLFISAVNCEIDFHGNTNSKVKAQNCKLSCKYCPNSDIEIQGSGNVFYAESNTNLKFQGNDCEVKAVSNSDLQLNVRRGTVTLTENQMIEVHSSKSDLRASENYNLKLLTEGGKISVHGTKNHFIKQKVQTSTEIHNEVSLVPYGSQQDQSSGYWGAFIDNVNLLKNFVSGQPPSALGQNILLTFNKRIDVNSYTYKLDGFLFTMEQVSSNHYRVQILEIELKPGSLIIRLEGKSECFVSAIKMGIKHVIKFKAKSVTSLKMDDKSFVLENHAHK